MRPAESDRAGCCAAQPVWMPILGEERDRREETAAAESFGPLVLVGESQVQVYVVKVDLEQVGGRSDGGVGRSSGAQRELGPFRSGGAERRGPQKPAGV